ncbi:VOC family protein [Aliikangiella coralliicola]|uniref:VOC family protein n=1 Tax=Aliikangiella coralliicola TaxID=2592383 RepID=A0A545UG82_9GAMM|nr:VOC family protein [Aliikangiella coralliicola]TQV88480.1 VOC family protein [Aliikangiella coralliicola]
MLNLKKIDHVGIRVKDKNVSIKFYESLGYEFKFDGGFEHGHPVIMLHPSGLVLNLLGPATNAIDNNILMDVDEKYSGYTHVAIEIESIEQAKALMEELNIEITGRHQFKGINTIFIRDPDRNVIELVEHSGENFFADTNSKHHH